MPIVITKNMLLDAKKGGYAIGAFNAENMEMVEAIIEAAQELNSPVIIQTTAGTLKYSSPEMFYNMTIASAKNATVEIALHLDHGDTFEIVAKALRVGYTSVMIDGSKETFEKNVSLTYDVVKMAHAMGVCVEAELGTVGGKEDGNSVNSNQNMYTDPQKAQTLVSKTNADSLAIGIGNAHGFYKGLPELRFDILSEVSKLIDVPIVLHGASGIPEEDLKKAILLGISKINFATELRYAFSEGVKQYIKDNPDVLDPKKYNAKGKEEVKKVVKNKILICGSNR